VRFTCRMILSVPVSLCIASAALAGPGAPATPDKPAPPDKPAAPDKKAAINYQKLPMSFEPNRGQADPEVPRLQPCRCLACAVHERQSLREHRGPRRARRDQQSLDYASYLGGSGGDQAYGVAADSAGNMYVTGARMASLA
jgi:Beta-propeller repeat